MALDDTEMKLFHIDSSMKLLDDKKIVAFPMAEARIRDDRTYEPDLDGGSSEFLECSQRTSSVNTSAGLSVGIESLRIEVRDMALFDEYLYIWYICNRQDMLPRAF